MEGAPGGALFRLLADDPLARIDVPHLAAALGLDMVDLQDTEVGLEFLVRTPETWGAPP